MARKNLLQGLMAEGTAADASPAPPRPPRRGAIGAVSRSIADLKARAIVEVDPRMVDPAGMRDRLDADDLAGLTESIRAHGQQVPVLLRVNPNDPERYQVVYGRRRVAALKALGQPVRAMVRDLDDRALVLAQGQENTARKDLSFIERANFARQMRDAGYERAAICDALSVDKTLVSRMLSVIDRLPLALVEAIGAAPSYGRERWLKLAEAAKGRDLSGEARGETSDARFAAVMTALSRPARTPAPAEVRAGRTLIARAAPQGRRVRMTFEDAAFADWLAARLPEIHDGWAHGRADDPDPQEEAR